MEIITYYFHANIFGVVLAGTPLARFFMRMKKGPPSQSGGMT